MPLARHGIDRDYLSRHRPELFAELAADPTTRVLPLWQGKTLLAKPPLEEPLREKPQLSGLSLSRRQSARLLLLPIAAAPETRLSLYLGRTVAEGGSEPAGTRLIAAVLSDDAAASLAEPTMWVSLRDVGAELSDRDSGLLFEAVALANWHDSHRFSPRTGQPLVAEQGGWVLRSADEATEVFPRTDPAIIVAVVDADDRLLLGSNALWEHNRYSLLAGFVEPGESLEAAVVREIYEESGIRIVDPVYLGSQPWPFPASLMVGFRALADPDQDWVLTPDGTEILDLRWFTRDELRGASDIILPGKPSISRAIIDDWLGGSGD